MVLLCVSLSYHDAPVGVLETFALGDIPEVLCRLKKVQPIQECAILQTCHRVEVYASGREGLQPETVLHFLREERTGSYPPEDYAVTYAEDDAVRHLFRVASGLDSLILGENEILHQVSSCYRLAGYVGALGPVLTAVFTSALQTAKRVRRETAIARGSLSIGNLAVKVAKGRLGSLEGRHLTIIGAGKIGCLIAKAVAKECTHAIVIANRTFSRAKKIADSLCGSAVRFDALEGVLASSDVVVCATAAPHRILTVDRLRPVLAARRQRPAPDLLIIDVSNPRGVDPGVKSLEGVDLLDLDDLAALARQNRFLKETAALDAERIIEENVKILLQRLRSPRYTSVISDFMKWAEGRRWKNLEQVLMSGGFNEIQKEVVLNFSYSLMRDLTVPILQSIRERVPEKPGSKMLKDIIEEASRYD